MRTNLTEDLIFMRINSGLDQIINLSVVVEYDD